eukprot:CAMPEP_0170610392 /NCGR_PEP_ID=MMETSP0224-20130122/22636_1 /TAXON_ID=285029 /ORGANISM="Togula jolla, Strain CCCM 725" /LENGTH=407 /DNA_ID=CAMNT_0010935767 /DNA_START=18 /DNA_END=1241 /DNA_ORIENTATION=+
MRVESAESRRRYEGLGTESTTTYRRSGRPKGLRHSEKLGFYAEHESLEVTRRCPRLLPHSLVDTNTNVRDLSEKAYTALEAQLHPNFLNKVCLDEHGGIDRIGELWEIERVLWFVVLLVSVVFNVGQILVMDWPVIRLTFWSSTHSEKSFEQDAAKENLGLDIFEHMDPVFRKQFFTLLVISGHFEILFLLGYCLQIVYEMCLFMRINSEFRAYSAITTVFQVLLPELSTFSSVALLKAVHPILIFQDYEDVMRESVFSIWGSMPPRLWFFVTRAVFAVVGLSAFATKMLYASFTLLTPRFNPFFRWACVAAFLNQSLFVVKFERVLQDRVFLLIYGGGDAEYQDEERALRNAYRCRLAKQIWQELWDRGERMKALIMLGTLNHYDLQRLLIIEDDHLHNVDRMEDP